MRLGTRTRRSSAIGPICPAAGGVIGSMFLVEWVGGPTVKDVDSQETTVRFWQKHLRRLRHLVEIHEKYPVDKGHRRYRDLTMLINKQIVAEKISAISNTRLHSTSWWIGPKRVWNGSLTSKI